MRKIIKGVLILLLLFAALIGGVVMSQKTTGSTINSNKLKDGRYQSTFNHEGVNFSTMWKMMDRSEAVIPPEGTIPVVKLSRDDLLAMKDNYVVRLCHSTLLFKIDGRFILTDPVFSESTSPVSFIGVKRFHVLPIALEELPDIDIVIISHNHYDHLDKATIKALKNRIGHIYTTLGIKETLIDFGVDAEKITELDWWQSAMDQTITLTATPTQHYSGRTPFDKDKTLWSSWVIKGSQSSIYFGSDSGYFDGFGEIGSGYGPFDMTFLDVGQYNEQWRSIHMMPEESVQAHRDLQGKILFPIHNGSFKISLHPWREPLERVTKEAKRHNIKLTHPKMGEAIPILKYQKTEDWWKEKE